MDSENNLSVLVYDKDFNITHIFELGGIKSYSGFSFIFRNMLYILDLDHYNNIDDNKLLFKAYNL